MKRKVNEYALGLLGLCCGARHDKLRKQYREDSSVWLFLD